MTRIKAIRGYRRPAILLGFLIISMGCTQEGRASSIPTVSPVVVKQSGGAGLLIADCQDRQYIIDTSDYIVEGRVEKVESSWNEDRYAIVTCSDLVIEKYVKGAPLAGDRLQIVTPGGTVGGITQAVEDQPVLHEGKKVRIYFQEIDGGFYIVCARFGVEDLGLLSP